MANPPRVSHSTSRYTKTRIGDALGYGEGSIVYDESKRLYVATVDFGIVDGRRKRVVRKAKTQAAILAKVRDLRRQKDEGKVPVNQTDTTAKWLDFWTDRVLPGTVAANTERQYREAVRDWIKPHVGHVPLAQLKPEHVQAMLAALADRGLSSGTQRIARTVLRRSLTIAQRWGKVTFNAAALVDPPKHSDSKLDDALDADQAAKVLAQAAGDPLEALAVLVLAIGVRQGEALDLRWADVDLDQAAMRVHGTKTTASVRSVALPPFVVAALRRHRAAQNLQRIAARSWADPDLVFTTSIGTRIHRRNVLRWWHALTVNAGVGRRRFHASRHTAATLMLNNGVPLEVVSATLGHAGLAITADVYAKVRPELQRTAATAMENLFGAGGAS
jgi:integrase